MADIKADFHYMGQDGYVREVVMMQEPGKPDTLRITNVLEDEQATDIRIGFARGEMNRLRGRSIVRKSRFSEDEVIRIMKESDKQVFPTGVGMNRLFC